MPNKGVRRWTFRLLQAALLLISSSCALHDGKSPDQFQLFKDGKAACSIILPENASEDIKKAVDEFRKDLRKGYQVEIPVGDAPNLPGRIELSVESRPVETEDGTEITFPSAKVARITGGESGVIRALFFLLEEFGGVRYLYLGEHGTYYPRISELSIPCETIRRDSCFPLERATSMTKTQHSGMLDRYFWPWEAKLGAKGRMRFAHELSQIAFPLQEYRKDGKKPDDKMFPLLHNARFLPYEQAASYECNLWQPCYGSRESVAEAAKNIIAYLKDNPQTKSLSLGINDGGGFCECDACLKLDGDGKKLNSLGMVHRSESYYRWLNQVVGRVSQEFPEVKFGCLAYREVLDPPSFKLHPNIVPFLCFDFLACAAPEIRAKLENLIRAWNKQSERLGFWAYDYGDLYYSLPRVYFSEQRDMTRFIRDHKGEGAFTERSYFTLNEGPKIYMFLKLLENPDLDIEKTLSDWCVACVGKDAAPSLRAYYSFWEGFWRTKATKTPWWQSRSAPYLMLGHFGTYMYGLEPKDMPHCRQLMERVVHLAEQHGEPDQKIRARMQMKCFEWSEAAATACGAGIFSADGTLPDAAAAAKLASGIPDALRSLAKWEYLLTQDPLTQAEPWYAGQLISKGAGSAIVIDNLVSVSDYLTIPAVKETVQDLSKNKDLPSDIRFVAENMLKGGGDITGNRVVDGDFEAGGDGGWTTAHPSHGKVGRVEGIACNGKGSLKCDISHENFTATKAVLGIKPNTACYFSARIFIPASQKASVEGRLQFWGNPTYDNGANNCAWPKNRPEIRLSTGKWNYVCAVVPAHRKTDSVRLSIRLYNFEKDSVAYIDDVQLFEMPQGKP